MLTPRQERFCQEYLIDLNGTQSAIRAGYSKRTANEQAAKQLAKGSIQSRLNELRRDREQRTSVTADRVVLELARLAFFDARALHAKDGSIKPIAEWDDAAAASVSAIEVDVTVETRGTKKRKVTTTKLKRFDKNRSLEMLGRHLGMFKDKLTIEHANMPDLSKLSADDRTRILAAIRPLFAPGSVAPGVVGGGGA